MKPIIPAVDRELLEAELTEEKLLRKTNNGNNLLYVITHHDSPNIMTEIGRLREISFRVAGGGTGKEVDIDTYDTMPNPYKQLIVWDPAEKEILGGYRYIPCAELGEDNDGNCNLATARLFRFSKKFREEYMPHMIELGRSFVQPSYQVTNRKGKGLYAMDNLWDGLGAIWMKYPDVKYFFGKVTMYTTFNTAARDLILYFMNKYFPDRDNLVKPFEPLKFATDIKLIESILCGNNYQEDYRLLSQNVRARGETIPPLINAYMNLSPTMKVFGTAMNYSFGDVEETAIMVTLNDMYVEKIERHIKTYNRDSGN
ncbi:MAG: GNAT family N-acetyltransferase [Bacteroidales bacterium]|nr:GNAT family N-acetyltransferase [Bacteroidales bacterium]